MREAIFITCLVLTASLSGCFGEEETDNSVEEPGFYPDIYSRHTLDWNWSDSYSYVLESGPYTALEVQEATITVDTTGVWGGGPNSADVHLSYWLPSNTEIGEQVPVIAVISPYFSIRSTRR